ncbi:MAG: VTC domain-containing protein, partial [Anaerolineales bacterium]
HTFNHCYVEIKQRLHGLVVKRRFELPKSLLGRLLQGQEVWDELVASRSGIEFNGCGEVYREFRWFLHRYQVIPKSIINYRRRVYQEDENELRITFDDDLAVFEPLPGLYDKSETLARVALGRPRELWPTIIMEIKCQNGYPTWLTDLIQSLQPKKLSKFTSSLNLLTSDIHLTPAEGDSVRFDSSAEEAPRRTGNGAIGQSRPEGDTTKASEIKL